MGRFLFAAIVTLALPGFAPGHEIPNDVTVRMLLKPQGSTLRLLVRVPLPALRDIEFPVRDGGSLDIEKADALLRDAVVQWISRAVEVYEEGARLPEPSITAARISLESDPSFASYETASAHLHGAKLGNEIDVPWNQTLLDTELEYPIASDRSRFSIRPATGRLGLRVTTVLSFLPGRGGERVLAFTGDPSVVQLDPRWFQAAFLFVRLGCMHILEGIDHLLFLLCVVIPFRTLRPLILIVTSFTVAHSITLIAAAFQFAPDTLWFPPLIEVLIACSILYMALENIAGKPSIHRRWTITFAFGLVHGFGFSFGLQQDLQLAGSHMLVSLLGFNVGVEIGQLAVLMVLLPALALLFRFAVAERMGTILLSALVAHTAWHWTIERGEQLRQYEFRMPPLNAALMASLLRWLMLAVALGGLLWFVRRRGRSEGGLPTDRQV